MVIKVGGRGDGWVSYFGKFCNPFQFAKFVFYNDLTKKYLVSFVYYHTSRIAKSRVDCRNPDSWYSLTFLYFYGLFLIYKSQKRRQKFCSNTCSNLFTRNPHTLQRLAFNYFIFSRSLFQPLNLITYKICNTGLKIWQKTLWIWEINHLNFSFNELTSCSYIIIVCTVYKSPSPKKFICR